jgi:nitrate/nitrite transporter NarK
MSVAAASSSPRVGAARWLALGAALATQAISVGATLVAFGFVLVPIAREFDASVATVNLGMVGFLPAQAAFGVLLGRLVDRFGARAAMLGGALVSALGFALIWKAPSLLVAGLGYVLAVAPGTGALGALPAAKLVADWFPDRRGFALGICGIGPSIGVFAAPILIAAAVGAWGWRGAVLMLAIAIGALEPLVALVDEAAPPAGADAPVDARPPSRSAFLRDRNFWVLTLCFGVCFGAMISLGNAYPTYGQETRGISGEYVGGLLGIAAVTGVIASIGIGWLADRVARIPLIWVAQAPLIVSFVVLALTPDVRWLAPLAAMAGIAQSMTPLWTATISDRFEPAVFGSVMGAMGFCMLPLTMTSLQIPMLVYERSGRFENAFAIFAVLTVASAIAIGFLRSKRATALP